MTLPIYHNDNKIKIQYNPQNNKYSFKLNQVGAEEAESIDQADSSIYDAGSIFVAKTGNDSTGTGTRANPYLTILKGMNSCTIDKVDVVVLDSGLYCEDLSSYTGLYFEHLYADTGQTPTLQRRAAPSHSNSNTIYVSKTGDDDTGDGTQETPYLTLATAKDACDANHQKVGFLDSGTYDERPFEFTGNFKQIFAVEGEAPVINIHRNGLNGLSTFDSLWDEKVVGVYDSRYTGLTDNKILLELNNGNNVVIMVGEMASGDYLGFHIVDNLGNVVKSLTKIKETAVNHSLTTARVRAITLANGNFMVAYEHITDPDGTPYIKLWLQIYDEDGNQVVGETDAISTTYNHASVINYLGALFINTTGNIILGSYHYHAGGGGDTRYLMTILNSAGTILNTVSNIQLFSDSNNYKASWAFPANDGTDRIINRVSTSGTSNIRYITYWVKEDGTSGDYGTSGPLYSDSTNGSIKNLYSMNMIGLENGNVLIWSDYIRNDAPPYYTNPCFAIIQKDGTRIIDWTDVDSSGWFAARTRLILMGKRVAYMGLYWGAGSLPYVRKYGIIDEEGNFVVSTATASDSPYSTSYYGVFAFGPTKNSSEFMFAALRTNSYNTGSCTITIGVNPVEVTKSSHGLSTGDPIYFTIFTGKLPGEDYGGVQRDTLYWVIYEDSGKFWIASSYANAMAGTKLTFNVTVGPGGGTISLWYCPTYYTASPLVVGNSLYIRSSDHYTLGMKVSTAATIDGVDITFGETEGIVQALALSSAGITLKHTTIRDMVQPDQNPDGTALYQNSYLGYGSQTVDIDNCLFKDLVYGIYAITNTFNVQDTIAMRFTGGYVFKVTGTGTGIVFEHCTIFGNYSGVQLVSNAGTEVIKNCIIHSNSVYDINSGASLIVTYSVVTGTYNNVTLGSGCINANPLFKNEGDLVEADTDLHLKMILLGDLVDSPAYNLADDSRDAGAYVVAIIGENDTWDEIEIPKPLAPELTIEPIGAMLHQGKDGTVASAVEAFCMRLVLKYDEGILNADMESILEMYSCENPLVKIFLDPETYPANYLLFNIVYQSVKASPSMYKFSEDGVEGVVMTFMRGYQ